MITATEAKYIYEFADIDRAIKYAAEQNELSCVITLKNIQDAHMPYFIQDYIVYHGFTCDLAYDETRPSVAKFYIAW